MLSCALAAGTVHAQTNPPAPAKPVSIDFETAAVAIANVAVGGEVVVFGLAKEYEAFYLTRRMWKETLVDTDRDGIVRLAIDSGVPGHSVWVAVDLGSGESAAAGTGGRGPVPAHNLRARRQGTDIRALRDSRKTVDEVAFHIAMPMLKVQEGILQDDPRQLIEGSALIVAEGAVAVGGKIISEALTVGWTSSKNLVSHFSKHGSDMGFKTVEGYGHAAQKFVSTSGKGGVETISRNGETFIYNRATKEFAQLSKDGKIIRYHKMRLRSWMRTSSVGTR